MSPPTSSNSRIVVRASIFLLLGGIVNIAVAWGIELRPPLSFMQKLATASFGFEWGSANGHHTWLVSQTGQTRITQTVGNRPAESALGLPTRISQVDSVNMVPTWSAFAADDPVRQYMDSVRPDLMLSFIEASETRSRHGCMFSLHSL
jgi:hypothetical protein